MSYTRKPISEEENKKDIEEWFSAAGKQTFDTLPGFIQHVMNDYVHDYGTVVHAIAACAIATAWACNEMEGAAGGITGFQASFVMWDFIRHWSYEHNKCGMKLVDYDELLYPQYGYKFEKTLSPDLWKGIKEEAQRRYDEAVKDIETGKPFVASGGVLAHWKSIADGTPPFGFVVCER